MEYTIKVCESVLGRGKPRRVLTVHDVDKRLEKLYLFQSRILNNHLIPNIHTLTESTTGSGKSLLMLCYAAHCAKAGRKVLIITPQLGISDNFRKYTRDASLSIRSGSTIFKLPMGSVSQEPLQDKVKAVKRYLRAPGCHPYVCTYQALMAAIADGRLDKQLANTVVLVDEAHHSSFDENYLGQVIRRCQGSCAEVHLFTATAFGTDGRNLVNGEFVKFRRTLKEHYDEGYCPDFGLYVRFYDKVSQKKYDQLSETAIGSSKALINAYIAEYTDHRLPTIMFIDSAQQAFNLEKKLRERWPGIKILNLGSEDGKTLESTHKHRLVKKWKELDRGDKYDVAIAIRLMNEGIDWWYCAQTFSPRISSSLLLLTQRAIGRAIRRKPPDHPSPDHSRVVLFEVGIRNADRDLVLPSVSELAIRLKALIDGIDFTDTFSLKLPDELRQQADSEKRSLRNRSNQQINNEILQQLYELATKDKSAVEIIGKMIELYAELGIELGPIAALELMAQTELIDKQQLEAIEEAISRKSATRLNARFTYLEFIEIFAEELKALSINGITDFVGLLSGRNDFDKVAEYLRQYMLGSAALKKQKLLELAARGEARPSTNTKLGRSLCDYTCNTSHYDLNFDQQIRALRPDWFEKSADRNRIKLLDMARNGRPKPLRKTKIGALLVYYTRDKLRGSEFDIQIRALRPDWFEKSADRNKKTLLEMAANHTARPSQDLAIGLALVRYTTNTSSYDQQFDKQIRASAPHWFAVGENKRLLLAMATSNQPKPKNRTRLRSALYNYSNSAGPTYDLEFDKQIRALRPDWFENATEKYKQVLLDLARSGGTKPHSRSKLGTALAGLKRRHRKFYLQVRALRPDWFESTVKKNKQFLLEAAKNGEKRPKCLTKTLSNYLNEGHPCFDSKFSRKIHSMRPDWFFRPASITKQLLLKMAISGAKRPLQNVRVDGVLVGACLSAYTSKKGSSYDLEFDTKILALRPDWFKK